MFHLRRSLRVTGHMYVICAMAAQRGPHAGMWSLLSGLTSPLVCKSYKGETCFSDPAARTVWNIPLDHLHLMWRQVHSKNTSGLSLPLSLSRGKTLLTIPIQHLLIRLICIFN